MTRDPPGPTARRRPGRTEDSPPRPPGPPADRETTGGGRAVAPWEGRSGPPHRRTHPTPRGGRSAGGGGGERGDGYRSPSAPGFGELLLPGGCNTRGGVARRHGWRRPPRATFPAGPSQPSRSRSRRTATVEVRPAAAGRRPGGGPPPTPPPTPPARPSPRTTGMLGKRRAGGGAGRNGERERSAGKPPARTDAPPG